MARLRRRSSGLGGEPRGDTGAPAISTLDASSPSSSVTSFPPSQKDTSRPSRRALARPRSSRQRGLFRRWIDLSLKHTWINPLIIILAVLSGYLVNPSPSNPLHSAIFLSYPLPPPRYDGLAPIHYGKGARDFAFVAFYIVVLSFTREFLMQRAIRPLAVRLGVLGRGKQARFMEQMYTAIYFAFFGPLGLYVMSRTPVWYFDTTAFFTDYPHKTHDAVFKAYYLLQASYWAQQAIVLMLQLEKPRKDFKELVGHHIITLALIWLSYRFHFTHMGLAVYITHDISDFFLATSKSLNYLDSPLVGPYFAVFVLVWVYLRHYINWAILWATLTTFRTVGPYDLNWETQQYKCRLSQVIAFSLLASLQAVNLFWLWLIVRIARNYVFKRDWVDERSENEEDEEDEGRRIEKADNAADEDGLSKQLERESESASRLHDGESFADAAALGTVNEKGRAQRGERKKLV